MNFTKEKRLQLQDIGGFDDPELLYSKSKFKKIKNKGNKALFEWSEDLIGKLRKSN